MELIGRNDELTALVDGVLRPDADRSVAAILGETGHGKTSLLATALERLPDDWTAHRVVGRELQQLVPCAALADIVAVAHAAGRDPFADVLRITADLVDLLVSASPSVLVVDDLHWVDEVTISVLDRLVDRLPDADGRLLVGSRPTDRPAVLHLLERIERVGVTIRLDPLDPERTEHLVARLTAGTPGPMLSELARSTAGNPLFIEELVAALEDDGALRRLGETVEVVDARVPRGFRTSVARRLGRLEPELQRTLRIAAALGDTVPNSLLASVCGIDELTLDERLAAAAGTGLLRPDRSVIEFRHDLVRLALVGDDPSFARAVHLTAARVIDDPVVGAAHLAAAGPPYAADQLLVFDRAAEALTERDPAMASELLEMLAGIDRADPERGDLRHRRIRALIRAGRIDEAHRRLHAPTADDDDLSLLLDLLDTQAERDQPDSDAVASALERSPHLDDDARRAAEARLAYHALRAEPGRFQDFLRALPEPDPTTSADTRAHVLLAAAGITALDGDLERAASTAWDAHRAAVDGGAGALTRLRTGLNFGVFGGDLTPWRQRAIDALVDATRLAEHEGFVGLVPAVHAVLANARWADGDWEEADLGYRSAATAATDTGVPRWLAEAHTGLCHMAADRGDREAAKEHLAACSAAADAYRQWAGRRGWSAGGTGRDWVGHQMLRARVAYGAGEFDAAIAAWRHELSDTSTPAFAKAVGAMDLTVCALAIDDRGALEAARECLGTHRVAGLPMSLAAPLVESALDGDVDAAIAVSRTADIGPVYAVAKTAEVVGFLAHDAGRADEAIERFERARAIWDRAGATALRAHDEQWLGTLGVVVRPPGRARPTSGWSSLTDAEARVVGLVATGALYREIADRLYVSRRTVESHVASAMRKVQVRNRGELTAAYYRHRGAPPEE